MAIEQVPANTIADLKTLLKTTQVPMKLWQRARTDSILNPY
ncbi:hypothetical protein [Latilactobacillus curvatus]|nr:hypothetical protein [Latilactobacillus curvatus]